MFSLKNDAEQYFENIFTHILIPNYTASIINVDRALSSPASYSEGREFKSELWTYLVVLVYPPYFQINIWIIY